MNYIFASCDKLTSELRNIECKLPSGASKVKRQLLEQGPPPRMTLTLLGVYESKSLVTWREAFFFPEREIICLC